MYNPNEKGDKKMIHGTPITICIHTMVLQVKKLMIITALCLTATFIMASETLNAGESSVWNKGIIDELTQYYLARASVEKQYGMLVDYQADKAVLDFLTTRKTQLQSLLKAKGRSMELEDANKATLEYFRDCAKGRTAGTAADRVCDKRYIDIRTGHLYVKNSEGNYDEFTRKGAFFKTVPADLPLLLKGKSVYPVSNKNYLLYSKKRHLPNSRVKVLSAMAPHPKGWSLETILVDLNFIATEYNGKITRGGAENTTLFQRP
jgi:hypothetical protein